MFGGAIIKQLLGPIASAAALVLLVMLIAARIHAGVLERQVNRLDDRINNVKTGYIVKLDAEHAVVVKYTAYLRTYHASEGIYQANEKVYRGRIEQQNKAIDVWKAEATRRVALANVALKDLATEKAAGQKLAAEVLAMQPTANAALDADLFILRIAVSP